MGWYNSMKKDIKNTIQDEEEDGTGDIGGQTGGVQFHYSDVLSIEPRDDVLSPEEIHRLLKTHDGITYDRVRNQKIKRQDRKILKEGANLVSTIYNKNAMRGTGGSAPSRYKTHPIAIKFSGIRDQNILPTNENTADINNDLRNELKKRLEPNSPQNTYRQTLNIKPRPM